jgi:hypothetical protein
MRYFANALAIQKQSGLKLTGFSAALNKQKVRNVPCILLLEKKIVALN